MKIITSLSEIKKMSLDERRRHYIPQKLRWTIPVKDCGEEVVRLDEFFSEKGQSIILASVWNKKDLPFMALRRGVAERLVLVNRSLKGEYRLKITDALRPINLQRKLFKEVSREIKAENPSLNESELRKEATRFVADPDGYPPHSTGGAVDLTLVDRAGQELDMGTPVDSLDERIETFHPSLTRLQVSNRLLLLQAMETRGFVNLASEWWHYSYGDHYWAAFWGKPCAIYDIAPVGKSGFMTRL